MHLLERTLHKAGVFFRFKQVLEWYDDVLGFSKTKFYLEQKKIGQKLANGHAEQVFGKSVA